MKIVCLSDNILTDIKVFQNSFFNHISVIFSICGIKQFYLNVYYLKKKKTIKTTKSAVIIFIQTMHAHIKYYTRIHMKNNPLAYQSIRTKCTIL